MNERQLAQEVSDHRIRHNGFKGSGSTRSQVHGQKGTCAAPYEHTICSSGTALL